MPHPLTEITAIDMPIEAYLRDVGEVFTVFGQQGSGTTSYGVIADGDRWFVKQSDNPSIVESLSRALHLHTTVQHHALPRLRHSFETPGGLAFVYGWVPGEVLTTHVSPESSVAMTHHTPTCASARCQSRTSSPPWTLSTTPT